MRRGENILIVLAAAMIGLIYGYDLDSIATAILFLGDDFQLTVAPFRRATVRVSRCVGGLSVLASSTNR